MTAKTLLFFVVLTAAGASAVAPTGMPPVLLSGQHSAMCNVAVGDVFPAVSGAPMKPGDVATVVAVVNGAGWMSRQLVVDLTNDVAQPLGGKGVAAVLLDARPGGKPADPGVQRFTLTAEAQSQLGTGRWPRVYLLDSNGRILWFDIEWGISSRRDLHSALGAVLADPQP
ncbi:hypothetical protein Pla175_41140 [Pirellulimonas nuda]|uniref:Thioredoxin domain-containing protein n=1 Tax=Pirellulimonas nuda TaxID=2528009 RepID=A0A518DGV4_9BACT|nr:hypothetical protein [Pirellulimonas nuda]QDU90704.1 hypothetical protein Pla175_41140 [Pirellulimonas nuda]